MLFDRFFTLKMDFCPAFTRFFHKRGRLPLRPLATHGKKKRTDRAVIEKELSKEEQNNYNKSWNKAPLGRENSIGGIL